MNTQPIKFYAKRPLTEAQRARIDSHRASVHINEDGTLDTTVHTIITPRGLEKSITYKTIRPNETERVMSLSDAKELFDDLQHINLIVTNACNLSCSYCYEQHNQDYGRFTPETLKQIYDFQLSCNNNDGKLFQFFGGEPLIHKQLILDFINKYTPELEQNVNRVHVSMITNGVLLTPEFIDSYFSHNFVNMSISLDTDLASVDHREIGQDRIDRIIDMIGLIPTYHKENHMVSVRCTIAIENAPGIVQFATRLYNKGLRAMVIHPLTMSSVHGFMAWPPTEWERLHQDILTIINTLPGFEVQFSEGVGVKGGANCLVGADMIAVDGSGDYSGCYFFTNQKEAAPFTILGNILNDAVYVDRYLQFQTTYNEMFMVEDQCKACDLKGFCYQCPAGNSDSGTGQLFRPDDMCQKIVRLFINLQDDIVKKSFNQKLQELLSAVAVHGEQRVFAKAIFHLMYKHLTGVHAPTEVVEAIVDQLPAYQQMLTYFEKSLVDDCGCETTVEHFTRDMQRVELAHTDIKTFYEVLLERAGKPTTASKSATIDDLNKRVFYLALIHLFVLNQKGNDLEKPIRIIKL